MKSFRIIPRLDIKQGYLIKGVQMEGWRKVGSPEEYSKFYYQEGADELLLMDVVASLYGRNSLHSLIKDVASNVFIPLTVGGGIRTIDDAYSIFEVGADKLSLNTAAISKPNFITELAKTFGNQAVVISLEVGFINGRYEVLTDNGRNLTGLDPVTWVKMAEDLGAGEVLLYNVAKDGTGKGFDLNLINLVSDAINLPVIVGGGYGKTEHLEELIENCDVSGMVAAQSLHWNKSSIHEIKSRARDLNLFVR